MLVQSQDYSADGIFMSVRVDEQERGTMTELPCDYN